MFGRRRWLMVAAGALALGALGSSCDDKTPEAKPEPGKPGAAQPAALKELRVGAYLSLSGAETEFGVQTKEGIELAVEEANKAGGVKGTPVKVLYEDDKSTPQETNNKVLQ